MMERGDYITREEAEADEMEIPDHLVAVTASNSGSCGGDVKVYHTTVCNRWPGQAKLLTKELADSWGYRVCNLCADTCTQVKGDYSYQEALKEAAKNE
jgi:hypothetical protein